MMFEGDELPNEEGKIQDSGGHLGGVRTRNLKCRVRCTQEALEKRHGTN
jgi:hypothetical protein